MKATWTCPECGERVPIDVVVIPVGSTLDVSLPDSAAADAFAHAWTHMEPS